LYFSHSHPTLQNHFFFFQSVFLATNSLGEKCVIKKFPINPQAFSQQAQTVNAFVEFFRRYNKLV